MRALEAHDHLCFSKSARLAWTDELNSFIVPSMVILKPNTLENYYSGSTRIYSLWCQRQNFLLCSFLLYIFPFENAHFQRWMSSRNILKEYKVQRPCKLSQGQTLRFRHVELVEKKNLSNFSTGSGQKRDSLPYCWLPSPIEYWQCWTGASLQNAFIWSLWV